MENKYEKALDEAHSFENRKHLKTIFGMRDKRDTYERILAETPNSSLFIDNALFEFDNGDFSYFAHLTTRQEEIISSGKIMSSSGCLVGSIYGVPVYKTENGLLRLHNLGSYILLNEVSYFSENLNQPTILLFEIKNKISQKKAGLNYLKLGKFHLAVFNELKFLLHRSEQEEVISMVENSINDSKDLIFLFSKYSPVKIRESFGNFFEIYQNTIKKVPIFGYFLFEIIAEFIVFYQVDDKSLQLKEQKEINVANFKETVFKTVPGITKNFDLGNFTPDLKKLEGYFLQIGMDFEIFKDYYICSVDFYIKNYLFNGQISDTFLHKDTTINAYEKICPHFVGHIIHRIVRKLNRYPDFYINFDTFKAIKIWNYWNENSVLFPYNSIIPKGEVGINPASPELDYKVYTTSINKSGNGEVYLFKGEEIQVKITPQLIEINKLLMRKKYEN